MNVADSYSIETNKTPVPNRQTSQSSTKSEEQGMRQEQSKLLARKLQEACDRARRSHNKSNIQMASVKSGKGVEMVYETIINNLGAQA